MDNRILCSGMRDKKNRKIYEHDIVKAYERSMDTWTTNEVVFEYGCFRLRQENRVDSLLCGYMPEQLEVVESQSKEETFF